MAALEQLRPDKRSFLSGLSTETKPTTGIATGSTYYETDTLRMYKWDSARWYAAPTYVTAEFTPGPALDAFGRLRVSNQHGILAAKHIHSAEEVVWDYVVAGSGAATFSPTRASVLLTTGTANGDSALKQTHVYFPYIPGKGQLIKMTSVGGTVPTNSVQEQGYGDDSDGLFLRRTASGASFFIRSSVSGSMVEDEVAQADWNWDRLDGTGSSGITLDLTKAQILAITFQWLGVGSVYFGFDIKGAFHIAHEFTHSNTSTSVYMATPSLPVRYRVYNTGTSTGCTLETICASVDSEGGYTLPGFEFSASNKTAMRTISARTPVLVLRMKNTLNGKANRRTARLISGSIFNTSANVFYEIAHVHHGATYTSATWTAVDADDVSSGVEYSVDATAVVGGDPHVFVSDYSPTSQAGKADVQNIAVDRISNHNFIATNIDATDSMAFVVFATPFTGSADVSAALNWIESD